MSEHNIINQFDENIEDVIQKQYLLKLEGVKS